MFDLQLFNKVSEVEKKTGKSEPHPKSQTEKI